MIKNNIFNIILNIKLLHANRREKDHQLQENRNQELNIKAIYHKSIYKTNTNKIYLTKITLNPLFKSMKIIWRLHKKE